MPLKRNTSVIIIFSLALFLSCATSRSKQPVEKVPEPVKKEKMSENNGSDNYLQKLMLSKAADFQYFINHKKEFNVQIIYTEINRGVNGIADLESHTFNLNSNDYFYPASTIKLPICILALQKLRELNIPGLDMNTAMILEADFSGQTAVYNDPSAPDGKASIAQYIKKILLVSDNDAFNRLYEFLGQQYINDQLLAKGNDNANILHRLNIFLSEEENRRTNPVIFLDTAGKVIYRQPGMRNNKTYKTTPVLIGKGYYRGNKLIAEPMDFSKKNRISLQDLHNTLMSLVFPEKFISQQQFKITETDRLFLLKYMSQYPTESTYPPYSSEPEKYWPAYCKFLLLGAEKGETPDAIRIFNKCGDAYGQLTDVSYIIDKINKVEFFLSATIYCNSDGILNDDKYDYDKVGLPFMKNLGRLIYEHELKRNYKVRPDLSPISFTYDK